MKKTIIILILVIICSCKEDKLLSNYYYLTDYESLDVGYPYGSIIYKSKQEGSYENILIYSDIKNHIANDEYIIVHQIPNESLTKKRILDDIEFWNQYFLTNKKDSLVDLSFGKMYLKNINALIEKKNKQIVVDSIFKESLYYKKMFQNKDNYYIIDKSRNLVFGPLNNIEFKTIKSKKSINLDF